MLHHEIPISFKWLRELIARTTGEDDEARYQHIKDTLARKFYSPENRSVICKKCQHRRFRTFRMCHFCEVYEDPDAYNACAKCFRGSKRSRVRENKVKEQERTLKAIGEILEG